MVNTVLITLYNVYEEGFVFPGPNNTRILFSFFFSNFAIIIHVMLQLWRNEIELKCVYVFVKDGKNKLYS